jgi:hypothetical protein
MIFAWLLSALLGLAGVNAPPSGPAEVHINPFAAGHDRAAPGEIHIPPFVTGT